MIHALEITGISIYALFALLASYLIWENENSVWDIRYWLQVIFWPVIFIIIWLEK